MRIIPKRVKEKAKWKYTRLKNVNEFWKIFVVLTIGISWTATWYEGNTFYRDYNGSYSHAVRIIEQRHADAVGNSEDAEQSVSDDEGASSDVSLDGGEEALSSSSHREVEMSAYTSRVEETDSSPCISADGTNICEYDGCVVAYNALPLGSKVNIEGFGECTVLDRMNARYGENNMDIYFGMDLEGALNFGRRNVNIEVLS